jgi:predicted MFS family arabinose efflux permease
VATFALLFGATFLVTAPLTAVFVRETFGTRHLGTITGTITMVHHVAGGLGALVGALIFDAGGAYDAALWLMLATSVVGCVLTLMLRQKHGA